MVTHISFDLDGTLAPDDIDNAIWNEEIPALYAEAHGVSIGKAKQVVYAAYYRAEHIEDVKEWADIEYWFSRLGLTDWERIVDYLRGRATLYPDTLPALRSLSEEYVLIVVSSAERKFLDVKLDAEGIRKYFTHVFSVPSDFRTRRKSAQVFGEITTRLDIEPSEMLHVGDRKAEDYNAPLATGVKALLLDRSRRERGTHVIYSLKDIRT